MLDYWLGQCYHARIKNNDSEILKMFKKRLEADQNLKKEAQIRLNNINNPQITNKCYISKIYTEILQKVLH